MHDPHALPDNLPVPVDDGAADHLQGAPIPDLVLRCTDGRDLALRRELAEPAVLFFYPRTGVPGQRPLTGFAGQEWEQIPGARGCTPQSCGFRDLYGHFEDLGIRVFGVSTQTTEYQLEFKRRNHVPFEYLSDAGLELVRAMLLPTFEFPVASGGPTTLIKRMSWFVRDAKVSHVWYPVFPPNENAELVLHWLRKAL
jgi:peroxiredoxin